MELPKISLTKGNYSRKSSCFRFFPFISPLRLQALRNEACAAAGAADTQEYIDCSRKAGEERQNWVGILPPPLIKSFKKEKIREVKSSKEVQNILRRTRTPLEAPERETLNPSPPNPLMRSSL